MVNRCATCGGVLNAEGPCPGCLMRLALDEPEVRERSSVRALLGGLGLGALLGGTAVAVVGGLVALSTGSRGAAVAVPEPSGIAALEPDPARRDAELGAVRAELAGLRSQLTQERARALAEEEQAELRAAHEAREHAARAAAEAARVERTRAERDRLRADAIARADEARQREMAEKAARVAAVRAREEAERARVEQARSIGALPEACDDLVQLETRALLGKLTPGERECLQAGLGGPRGEPMARMLAEDASSRGDMPGWARWVEAMWDHGHHPEVAYELARHHRGRSAWGEARAWSEKAFAARTGWTGATYTARVETLLRWMHDADVAQWGAEDRRSLASAAALAEFSRSPGDAGESRRAASGR